MANIDQFGIPTKELYDLLVSKGVKFLYHANTVSTAITFIENGALLSREYVEKNELTQTSQKSDEKDKKVDVWDHVFLDGFDLHDKYNRANKYGPVLFFMNLELLLDAAVNEVFITKSNPYYWTDQTPIENKFYSAIEEVDIHYLTSKKIDAQIMFTFRSPELSVSLKRYLCYIGVDCPKMLISLVTGEQMAVGDYATKAIRKSLAENNLDHVEVMERHKGYAKTYCGCHFTYNRLSLFNRAELKKLFGK